MMFFLKRRMAMVGIKKGGRKKKRFRKLRMSTHDFGGRLDRLCEEVALLGFLRSR